MQDLFRHLRIHTMTKKNKIKKVIKGLEKASKSHSKQAKTLKSVLTNGKRSKKRNG
jgi:hypothetical protein